MLDRGADMTGIPVFFWGHNCSSGVGCGPGIDVLSKSVFLGLGMLVGDVSREGVVISPGP